MSAQRAGIGPLPRRVLGRCGVEITSLGFGAFKIGRNTGTKYAEAYDLPDMAAVATLLHGVLDLGINYIDTAPAYGLSEERIGAVLGPLRGRFVLSTKVGEQFVDGMSRYDFSTAAIESSLAESLRRTKSDAIDVVFIHAHADDVAILQESDAVPALQRLRERGWCRAIGLSAKTPAAAREALGWADALMVEYHLQDRMLEPLIAEAAAAGVGVVVKKALASGRLPADEALGFVLANRNVTSAVVGGLSLEHLRANAAAARAAG